jgi:signal transduction histidine kinase/DNA-binding response OmpR family regulator/CHASE3 domain sensor protein
MKPSFNNSIIRQLQIVFSISIILLIASLCASFFSTRKLIESSKLVNHTNEVLIQAENIISNIKDAETSQRGYIISLDPVFLTEFNNAYAKVIESYRNIGDLTIDNRLQQKNLAEMKDFIEERFSQMETVIRMFKNINAVNDTSKRHTEIIKGKIIMDDLRKVVERIENEERKLLEKRLEQQNKYVNSSPILLILASLISILITAFAYFRIKKDLNQRITQEKEAQEKYIETSNRIAQLESVTRKIAQGNYSARSNDKGKDDLGRISIALNKMTIALENTFNNLKDKTWLQTGAVELGKSIRGQRNIDELSSTIIKKITSYVNAPLGTIYVIDQDFSHFKLRASYGVKNAPSDISFQQGLIGQIATDKKTKIIEDVPPNYIITSSLGNTTASCLVLLPLVFADKCLGVIEIGFLKRPTTLEIEYLEVNLETLAISLNSALDYFKMQNLLEETQAQSEELQAQHNELENLNSELETQAQKLQASEEELRVQQEELQQTNEELEERSVLLEEKNIEIEKKAQELEKTTKYKSEFLANMSHELRTPLNSILLLSRLLSENDEKNMNTDQVEYAKVIQNSGNGLLGLIDEILDLSKIEAGKMDLEFMNISIHEIVDDITPLFKTVAKEKNIDFIVRISEKIPPFIETDKVRLEQIIKNLISNALKFTSKGSVTFEIKEHSSNAKLISFIVKDTGIGIAPEKQHLIFEAFQQADGSTKRKYGGTGLGLSISRQLAKLLHGDITLNSKVDEGSEFILTIPIAKNLSNNGLEKEENNIRFDTSHQNLSSEIKKDTFENQFISTVIPEGIPDDRSSISEKDKVILIIEDDTNFAKSLLDYTNKKGYKGVVAVRGDEGLELANTYKPLGILLDIQLPIMSGWEVMDKLKANPKTRHIPVHIMSSHKLKNESLIKGAVDFIDKPLAFEQMQEIFSKIEYVLNKKTKKVLIIDDNPKHAQALAYFLQTFNINSELKSDVTHGINSLKKVDCVILDMGIPDAKSYEILEEAKKNQGLENLPIIVFTGKSLSPGEEQKIKKYADSIIVKTAHSYQRMLDEVSLFLHLVEENKEASVKNGDFKKLGALAQVLENKTVLVADDDVRNVFSLTKALEKYKMDVIAAVDGKEALQKLEENPAIDIVLLDIMMPEMDGYETVKRIRNNSKWKNLPVIAVTAKAMMGDREKCINAGASDYITKPVDMDQLMSLLRVWLYDKS